MTASTVIPTRQARPVAGRLVVAAAFLLAFLWQIYGALSNLVVWVLFADRAGGQLSAFAWVVLLLGVAIPVVAYAAALVLGRRARVGLLALILLVAVCASQALSLSQLAFFLSVIGAL